MGPGCARVSSCRRGWSGRPGVTDVLHAGGHEHDDESDEGDAKTQNGQAECTAATNAMQTSISVSIIDVTRHILLELAAVARTRAHRCKKGWMQQPQQCLLTDTGLRLSSAVDCSKETHVAASSQACEINLGP